MKSASVIRKKKSLLKKKSSTAPRLKKEKKFPVVAIGASAGGLEAMSILLKNLPADTGMAYIYVQHLSPDHKSFLPSILSKITKMKVQEIDDMELMKPNNVYVIPHNKEIMVLDGHIQLLPRLKNISVNPSIDILFSSLAETHKKNVIGVVLSGYASDGTHGLKAIKEAGGITFAQDSSAQAASMPNSAIAAGVVDFILSPKGIARKLTSLSKNNFLKRDVKRKSGKNEGEDIEDTESDLKTIFGILHKITNVDFSHYKMTTINRRLKHRMQQSNKHTLKEYAKLLLKNDKEVDILYKDLLVNVTSFFRDVEVFRYLKTTFLPKLLKSKTIGETLRIWIPACSTGQEVYSIAMLITELQDNKTRKIPVKIFATDLSEHAILTARIGEYAQNDMEPIAKDRVKRFFSKTRDHYHIAKEIREMCVFAPHNILRDPSFFRMDFISCRNLLIYFDAAAQKKALASMHFALNDGGYVLLGKAETTGATAQLFTQLNNKFKIYSKKKDTAIRIVPELTPRFPRATFHEKNSKPTALKNLAVDATKFDSAIDSALLSNYMPACAIINTDMEILQFRGLSAAYLSHPSGGKASLNILKMTRPEFAFELRNAIYKAIKTKQSIRKSGIEIKIDNTFRMMSLEVCPLKIDWDEPLFLIVFTLQEEIKKYTSSGKNVSTQKDIRIKKLIEELTSVRAEMNSVIESQETAFEELQAANEEIVSTNEESQTLNEELETSKEEIQATNEELVSTNQELKIHNDLLAESYNYSEAIIATIHEPMLVLDNNLRVKSANKSFYKKFLVKKDETETMSLFELGNKQWNIPKLRKVLNDILYKNSSFENFEVTHTFPGIGEKIMLLNAHLIIQKTRSEQLILLAIEDVTEARKLAIELNVKELKAIQNEEREKRAVELTLANKKLIFQNKEKEKRAAELIVANKELAFQNKEKEKRASELAIANKELIFQNKEKEKRAAELAVAGVELAYQNKEKEKQKIATKELEEAKSKAENATQIAEDAVKAKQQFLSNMSHEIRTPMNAIIGFTKVVLKTDLSAKQKEYLSAIKVSGDALIVLINDILDLAKVDAGKMTFENTPFKMANSISTIFHLFETKVLERNLELIKDYDHKIPEVLLGDSVRLHQIMLNLLSNAVKFTSTGKITVSVHLLNEDQEHVTIKFTVTDTGIGIAENKISTIFENFQQATSDTSRLFGGTGLGLAIVKQLVEKQNGEVHVKSKIGEGSTFSFILKFQKTKAESDTDTDTNIDTDTEIKNIKVLVVEDIALNQLLMKTILDDFGFERDIASNGKIAIEKLQTKSYDIILMDLQMPEMNGFEATEYIRNTMNSKIPIIALTADVTTVDLEKCKALGINDYIAKPVDEKLLYRKIVDLVKKLDAKKNSPKM